MRNYDQTNRNEESSCSSRPSSPSHPGDGNAELQCSEDHHEQVGVLPAGRHLRHDPDQNHRILRRNPEVAWLR